MPAIHDAPWLDGRVIALVGAGGKTSLAWRITRRLLARIAWLVSKTADGPLYLGLALVLASSGQEPRAVEAGVFSRQRIGECSRVSVPLIAACRSHLRR